MPTSVILLGTGGVLVVAGVALVIVARRHGEATSPGTAAAIAVALVAGAGGVLVASPCDVETKYHCASVRPDAARPGGQVLVLDTLRHSYVDAGDPAHLEFGYMRTFAAALDTLPSGASSVLHVGGGGMTLPRYLLQARPEATHTVVEIDPGVVEVDRSRLALPDDPRLRVEVADGRVAVAGYPDDSFDAYVGDAFGGIAVPWHLTTRETFEDVARVLRPGGLVVLNVIDFRRLDFARAEVATLASVFDHVALAAAPGALDGAGGNLVILASDQPIDRVARRDGDGPTGVADGARRGRRPARLRGRCAPGAARRLGAGRPAAHHRPLTRLPGWAGRRGGPVPPISGYAGWPGSLAGFAVCPAVDQLRPRVGAVCDAGARWDECNPPVTGETRDRQDQRRWVRSMRQYELMVILDPETEERSVGTTMERYLAVIKKDGGTVDNVDIWGRRRLAYDIKKKSEGIYTVVNFTAEPATAQELDRQLNLNESIMRTKLLRPGA